MKLLYFLFGILLAVVLVLVPVNRVQPFPSPSLQTLAVQLDGRKKPLDTVAQETITTLHGSAEYRGGLATGQQSPGGGQHTDALSTYLALWFNDRDWNQEPFILFSYRPLKERLGLPPDQKHFSFQTLATPALADIIDQAHQHEQQDQPLSRDEREALILEDRLALMLQTVGRSDLPIVPHPSDRKGRWLGISAAATDYPPATVTALEQDFEALQDAYLVEGIEAESFQTAAAHLHQNLAALSPNIYPEASILKREVHFNQFHPFGYAWVLYAIAFGLMLTVLWGNLARIYWTSIGLFTAGVALQTYGFWLRVQVADRPPVTNMYESVIWVGFGIAALALIFELQYRSRYYLLAAAPLSVLCLVLADRLPAVLDPSISPLVPVLRDNFWLSIHVPTITLSYACFALAMGLGHIVLGNYLFTPQAKPRIQTLSRLNYRVVQVGVLLLTTGIILGGIWAHFSWGRFWGWDPKETWALIALLCYLAPLHGRLVGWLGNFGMGVATVVSFNAVLMAWYGVNFVLGTGLHK